MSVRELQHYIISPAGLAEWLDRQPGTWWLVDGDPRLTGEVDFPCPSEELSKALRRYNEQLLIYAGESPTETQAEGQEISPDQFDKLPDRDNPEHARTFLISWKNQDVD